MDQRPHIVVVEDEAAASAVDLARQNFRVSGVDGGFAFAPLVGRELPALVMLDVGLPGRMASRRTRWLQAKRAGRYHHGHGGDGHRRSHSRARNRR
jgi:DNA-binding response OmpR family regulator